MLLTLMSFIHSVCEYIRIMKPALTNKQKRAAHLLVTGLSVNQVSKLIYLKPHAIWKWKREIPKFQKYLNRLNTEYDLYIDQLQKSLLKKAFKSLRRMLDSHDTDSVQFAIESLLKINRRYPETMSRVLNEHKGSIDNIHKGE